jgi:glycosyltransferase involved in cell wall biosynthesis
MSGKPLVSIVTPSYNQADFLGIAIQSVLQQDYPNLEYGIMDGGSTDRSLDVIKKYQDELSWWVSEPDQGQSHAINKGISRAKGEIVAWLNSDDLYLPGAISAAVRSLERYDADLVFGNAIIINEKGMPLNDLVFDYWDIKDFLRFRVICQPAVVMKKYVWEEVSGLDTDLHFLMDHHLWIKIASKFSVKYIPSFWAASRFHTDAKNVALAADFSKDIKKLLNWIRDDNLLSGYFDQDKNRILGGAYRLSGRYLLDGGYPKKSLQDYLRGLLYWPSYTIKHWRRILFALVSILTSIKSSEIQKSALRKYNESWGDLTTWPGIDLSEVRQ